MMKYLVILTLLLIWGCATTPSGTAIVGNQTIEGAVVDARTASPVVSALVVITVPKGNSWSLPSSYLVGYTYTDSNGKFRIPAQPHAIEDIRRNNSPISIDVYHSDYKQAVDFIPRSASHRHPVTVKMEKGGYIGDLVVGISNQGCSYNNPEICRLVKGYLGL